MNSAPAGTAKSRGVVSVVSPYPFADTVNRLVTALTSHGLKIFATIDQRGEAQAVGQSLVPTTLIVFGNPRTGTALMAAHPEAGLDLPLKVLVSEPAPGKVFAHFNAAGYIIERHALPAELAANIAPAERLIASTLQG